MNGELQVFPVQGLRQRWEPFNHMAERFSRTFLQEIDQLQLDSNKSAELMKAFEQTYRGPGQRDLLILDKQVSPLEYLKVIQGAHGCQK